MEMEIVALPLIGPVLIKPRVFRDERGFFVETFSEPSYRAGGIAVEWAQDNHSRSVRRTLRGMHFQTSPGQAKLVRAATGTIFDVVVDLRKDSPTYGRWHGEILDADSHHQLFVPVGFAHGFCVLSDIADVVYKMSSVYDAAAESGFHWADPDVGIAWPIEDPIVSTRDRDAKRLAELA